LDVVLTHTVVAADRLALLALTLPLLGGAAVAVSN
jgi:hypothetical protein